MNGTSLFKRLFSAGSSAISEAGAKVSISEPGYLTRQEADEILAELIETDTEGHFIPPVAAYASCPQRIYVALAASLPVPQRVLSCAGLCYIQLLDDPDQEGRVRVAALPSHLELASRWKVRTLSLREEHLHLMLPWDRTLQRLATCCVRDVLQVYASRISGVEVPAHPYAWRGSEQPTQMLPCEREQQDVAGEALPEQVFIPVEIAQELANQFKTTKKRNCKKICSPRFFWLKAIITTLQQQRTSLSTFETMLFKMLKYLKKRWQGEGKVERSAFQIQATPVRKEQTCLGWSLLLGFPQTTLRAWGF